MGQVFRARDTRLGRTVAVKVSLKHFNGRFEREARAIAAMKRGPVPLDQARRYAAQLIDRGGWA
jgi:serine/threonine protein kinase